METKMKKIPFDLERAKKGELFYIDNRIIPYQYLANDGNCVWFKRNECIARHSDIIGNNWHHLIPDEPKPERWAVVHKSNCNYKSEEDAKNTIEGLMFADEFTVVKLAQ